MWIALNDQNLMFSDRIRNWTGWMVALTRVWNFFFWKFSDFFLKFLYFFALHSRFSDKQKSSKNRKNFENRQNYNFTSPRIQWYHQKGRYALIMPLIVSNFPTHPQRASFRRYCENGPFLIFALFFWKCSLIEELRRRIFSKFWKCPSLKFSKMVPFDRESWKSYQYEFSAVSEVCDSSYHVFSIR